MRTNKSLFFVVAALMMTSLVACGGDDDDGGGTPDSGVMLVDAAQNPDAPSAPDANNVSAANLGQLCGAQGQPACPAGYSCIAITGQMNEMQGFCTLPCTMPGMIDNCNTGFPGPGLGACLLTAQGGGSSCAIACGQQVMGGSTACPTGLTCQDFGGPNGTPDGMGDTCAP
jgi:hypothetical protein